MSIKDFIKKVTAKEGKKRQISIAQVSEVCRVINDITNGLFYKLIRSVK